MKKLYLFGGGGHALSCIDVIEKQKQFNIAGIFDNKFKLKKKILGYPIIKQTKVSKKNTRDVKYGLVCVGQIKSPDIRIKIFNELIKNGFFPAKIISPFALVARDVKIGKGTIIMHGAIVNPKAKIGKNCIINTGCIIEHEAVIGDHCHIATGVIVNGGVIIKDKSFIGSGSVIIQKKIIKKKSIIPMGSIIKK